MYFSYLISFGVIALLWLKHLHFNNHMRRYSAGLIWLNFLFLLVIAFLPFPTAVYGTHSDDVFAEFFYAASVSLAGYIAAMMWVLAIRNPDLMHEGIDIAEARHTRFISFIMPTAFAISAVLSLVIPGYVPYIWIAFAVISPLLRKF